MQAEQGYSLDSQTEILTDFCKVYGRTIFRVYADRGISGKSMKERYELQQLLSDAKKGLFDEVLVYRFNRMARRTLDLLQIVDDLSKYNVGFKSFSESFDTTTPMGKFSLNMMGAIGELERNTIVEKCENGPGPSCSSWQTQCKGTAWLQNCCPF
jgi:site-specific DNA recombinase